MGLELLEMKEMKRWECAKCHMTQCMDDCHMCWMAQVTVKSERAGF